MVREGTVLPLMAQGSTLLVGTLTKKCTKKCTLWGLVSPQFLGPSEVKRSLRRLCPAYRWEGHSSFEGLGLWWKDTSLWRSLSQLCHPCPAQALLSRPCCPSARLNWDRSWRVATAVLANRKCQLALAGDASSQCSPRVLLHPSILLQPCCHPEAKLLGAWSPLNQPLTNHSAKLCSTLCAGPCV